MIALAVGYTGVGKRMSRKVNAGRNEPLTEEKTWGVKKEFHSLGAFELGKASVGEMEENEDPKKVGTDNHLKRGWTKDSHYGYYSQS